MEVDAIVEIAKDLQDSGVKIVIMVGDDSSARKKLQEECGSEIQKRFDLNHVKKPRVSSLCPESKRPCRTF